MLDSDLRQQLCERGVEVRARRALDWQALSPAELPECEVEAEEEPDELLGRVEGAAGEGSLGGQTERLCVEERGVACVEQQRQGLEELVFSVPVGREEVGDHVQFHVSVEALVSDAVLHESPDELRQVVGRELLVVADYQLEYRPDAVALQVLLRRGLLACPLGQLEHVEQLFEDRGQHERAEAVFVLLKKGHQALLGADAGHPTEQQLVRGRDALLFALGDSGLLQKAFLRFSARELARRFGLQLDPV